RDAEGGNLAGRRLIDDQQIGAGGDRRRQRGDRLARRHRCDGQFDEARQREKLAQTGRERRSVYRQHVVGRVGLGRQNRDLRGRARGRKQAERRAAHGDGGSGRDRGEPVAHGDLALRLQGVGEACDITGPYRNEHRDMPATFHVALVLLATWPAAALRAQPAPPTRAEALLAAARRGHRPLDCEEVTGADAPALATLGDSLRGQSLERATEAYRLEVEAARCAGADAQTGAALNQLGTVLNLRGLNDEAAAVALESE